MSAVPNTSPAVAVLRILSGTLADVIKTAPPDLRAAAEAERALIEQRLSFAIVPELNTSAEDKEL